MRKLLVLIILILVSIFVNSAFGNEYEYFTMDSYLEFNGKDSYVGKMKGIAQRSDFTVEGLIYLAGDSLSGSTGYGTFLGSSGKNRLLIHTKVVKRLLKWVLVTIGREFRQVLINGFIMLMSMTIQKRSYLVYRW